MKAAGKDVDPSLGIIELSSIGTKVKNTKRFWVVNPTAEQ